MSSSFRLLSSSLLAYKMSSYWHMPSSVLNRLVNRAVCGLYNELWTLRKLLAITNHMIDSFCAPVKRDLWRALHDIWFASQLFPPDICNAGGLCGKQCVLIWVSPGLFSYYIYSRTNCCRLRDIVKLNIHMFLNKNCLCNLVAFIPFKAYRHCTFHVGAHFGPEPRRCWAPAAKCSQIPLKQ